MRSGLQAGLVLVLALALAACERSPMAAGERVVTYLGAVAEIHYPPTAETGSFLMTTARPGLDKLIVHVDSSASVSMLQEDGSFRRARLGEVTPGSRVRVWTTGGELRSLPPQVYAVEVQVLFLGASS